MKTSIRIFGKSNRLEPLLKACQRLVIVGFSVFDPKPKKNKKIDVIF